MMKTFFFNALSIDDQQEYIQFKPFNVEQDHKLNTYFYDDAYPIGVNNASHWYRYKARLSRKSKK